MLFIVVVAVWFVGGTAGALYFQSPRRRIGYDRQHAVFTYAQGAVFGLLPALGGAWGWSIFTLPLGVLLATKIIDRRRETIWQSEQAGRHHRSDGQPSR
jgi:hypothetical protein